MADTHLIFYTAYTQKRQRISFCICLEVPANVNPYLTADRHERDFKDPD